MGPELDDDDDWCVTQGKADWSCYVLKACRWKFIWCLLGKTFCFYLPACSKRMGSATFLSYCAEYVHFKSIAQQTLGSLPSCWHQRYAVWSAEQSKSQSRRHLPPPTQVLVFVSLLWHHIQLLCNLNDNRREFHWKNLLVEVNWGFVTLDLIGWNSFWEREETERKNVQVRDSVHCLSKLSALQVQRFGNHCCRAFLVWSVEQDVNSTGVLSWWMFCTLVWLWSGPAVHGIHWATFQLVGTKSWCI